MFVLNATESKPTTPKSRKVNESNQKLMNHNTPGFDPAIFESFAGPSFLEKCAMQKSGDIEVVVKTQQILVLQKTRRM